MKRYIAILLSMLAFLSAEGREIYSLNNYWRFFFKNENTSDVARFINLPHTWNLDAMTGRGSYVQSTGNYLRDLYIPSEWEGKRLFLRFYGVQSVADVFINGEHAGEHRGGWTAFTIEITDNVRYGSDNLLHVMVSNAYENDVLPVSTEMNLYGGIYRDVELIVTDRTIISPTFYGTDGLLVKQTSVTRDKVDASVVLYLSSPKESSCNVSISIIGPDGYVAVSRETKAKADGKAVNIPFTIENPELWSTGRPNLYTVEAVAGTDTVRTRTGFRCIEVTPEKHFMLNSKTVPVRGVTLYHDRLPAGNALTEKDYESDLRIIRDMGANAIRSATAPHMQYLYDRCDEEGMLVWIDFPLTQSPFPGDIAYIDTDRFKDNGRRQVQEIIAQNYNHPSVVMWGVFSLIKPRGNGILEYVRELNGIAKKFDTSRPTVACSNQDGDINFITDLIVWQQSYGWDKGKISDLKLWTNLLSEQWGHLRQAICYGANSAVGEPSDIIVKIKNRQNLIPEIWQTRFHEGYVAELADDDLFWGIWINNMFDFGSTRYFSGVLNAGLGGFDHTRLKDIYYLYRAMWNTSSPTLHIKGKTRQYSNSTAQSVKFYSSSCNPILTINGDTVRTHRTGPCLFVSDTIQMRGSNAIAVSADGASDSTTLTIGNLLKHR